MPLLLGLHMSLKSISDRLLIMEKMFAFLDDISLVCRPNRVAAVYEIVRRELQRHTNVDIHCGKTKIWNRSGEKPSGVDQLTAAARVQDPCAIVWRGDAEFPVSEQGMKKVLGVPLGRDKYARFLEKKTEHHDTPLVPDVQASWLLLSYCAATRANFYLRNVTPEVAHSFAISHDLKVHHCLCKIIVDPDDVSKGALQQSTLPFHLGGLGYGKCPEVAPIGGAGQILSTMLKKDPGLAATVLTGLNAEADGCFAVVYQCADRLVVLGVELPTWDALVAGATRDHVHATIVEEPCVHRGWQQHVSNTIENVFQTEALWPSLDTNERALALSQSGPLAGVPFHCLPTSPATRLDSEIFRTLLLRRLRLPLPLNARVCRCGRLLDCLGHHRSACAVSCALGRRGFQVEVAVARVCREGGARVSTNVMVRDLDLSQVPGVDGRR